MHLFNAQLIGAAHRATLLVAATSSLLLVLGTNLDARGQIGGSATLANDSPLDLLRQRMAQSAISAGSVPQEGAVDPAEYRVGPGDVFQVSVGGVQATLLPLTVGADGNLTLPDAGAVYVAGLSLEKARVRVIEQLKLVYRNVPVTATLSQPRQFYVHVVGAVTSPGRFLVMPIGRVLDAVSFAFADTTRPATANLRFQPSFRNISISGTDDETRTADLVRYLITGETQYNPYVRDGDVIRIGAYDPTSSSVFINGDVPFAGTYEYRPDDTVADLLALAAGRGNVADRFATVRITRRNPDGTVSTIPLADGQNEAYEAISVEPLDQIYFESEASRDKGMVTAEGALAFPGSYPIERDRTTLLDLIEAAGGFREDALLRAAYVERRSALAMTEFPVRFVGLRLGPNVPPLYLPDTSAVLKRIRLAPLDWRGTNYVVREMQYERRVVLDLANASEKEMANVRLMDGDRLVVPRNNKTVFVFGQVERAGMIPFEAKRNVSHYIASAGGKAELASDVYLIDAGTGAYRKGESHVVRDGDMIFVDSRDYLADTVDLSRLAVEQKRIEADQRTRTAQIVIQTIGSIASIIALIIAARR